MLIMLLLGIVTLGVSYSRSISLSNSAREAARFGATLPVDGDVNSWLEAVADVASDSAAGDLDDGVPGQSICVAYVYPDGSAVQDRTVSLSEINGSRRVNVGVPCFADSRPSGERRVQIAVERESQVETGIYSRAVTLEAEVMVRFERSS